MIKLPDDSAFELAFRGWHPNKTGPYVKHQMQFMWYACIAEVQRLNATPSADDDLSSTIKTFQVGWLNKCRCGNKKLTVKTIKGNSSSLWDDDDVICNECGRKGIIQCNEGHAGVWWETDEEYLESQRLNATAQPVSEGWIFEACENEPCQNGAVVKVHGADIHLCAACSGNKKYSRMKITALPKRLSFPLPAAPGGQGD